MDRIRIEDLRVRCILGIGPEERRERQDVLISATLFVDLRQAGRRDRVEDSVDYRAVKKEILAAAEASEYRLAEALAEKIAEVCLRHEGVDRVALRVEKPGAL